MELLDLASDWFTKYVNEFKSDNSYIKQNIDLKKEHTENVVLEAISLAKSLAWSESDVCLAGLIARFHDLARFEQFSQYQTFKDRDSRDHGDWAVELFEQLNPLPQLAGEARAILLLAIRYHNKKLIPNGLTDRELLHCRLIRDADKIDIYRVVTESDVSFVGVGSQEHAGPSPHLPILADNLLNGVLSDNANLRRRDELILLQLGWIYDLNYQETLRRIDRRGYLQQMIAELPEGRVRLRIEKHIQQTIAEKLALTGPCL